MQAILNWSAAQTDLEGRRTFVSFHWLVEGCGGLEVQVNTVGRITIETENTSKKINKIHFAST